MLQILNVIVPIYVLIGIGYVMTRFGPSAVRRAFRSRTADKPPGGVG